MQSSPLWKHAEWGEDPTHAHPNAVTRPAAGRHHGAHATPRPQAPAHATSERVAWQEPRASAAGGPNDPRTHTARTSRTAHPHIPRAAHVKHTSQGRVVCCPHWTLCGTRGWTVTLPALRRGAGGACTRRQRGRPRVLHRADGGAGREDAHLVRRYRKRFDGHVSLSYTTVRRRKPPTYPRRLHPGEGCCSTRRSSCSSG
jgi:hypothetical protein